MATILNNRKYILLGVFLGISISMIPPLFQRLKQLLKKKPKPKPKPKKTLLDFVGNTPLIYLPRLSAAINCHVYCKAEFMNPFGSSKDRAVKKMLEKGIQRGKFKQQFQVVEASSGSTAITLVQMCKILGFTPVIFLTNDLAPDKYMFLETLGAQIIKVPPVSIVDREHFVNKAYDYAKEHEAFLLNQFDNLDNAAIHEETTGKQIYQQLESKIDAFVCSAGTGGTIAGISRYLKNKSSRIQILLADPEGSGLYNRIKYGLLYAPQEKEGTRRKNPFDTVIEGVGLNRPTENFDSAKIDDAYKVSDLEALHMAHYLIENEGLFVGGSCAVNLAAVVKYGRENPGKTIVTVLHDSGNRYLKKIYSEDYLREKDVLFHKKAFYDSYNLQFIQ